MTEAGVGRVHNDPITIAGCLVLLAFGVIGVVTWPLAALTCGLGSGFILGVMVVDWREYREQSAHSDEGQKRRQ